MYLRKQLNCLGMYLHPTITYVQHVLDLVGWLVPEKLSDNEKKSYQMLGRNGKLFFELAHYTTSTSSNQRNSSNEYWNNSKSSLYRL